MEPQGDLHDWCDTVPNDFVHKAQWQAPWCGWEGCATRLDYFPQMEKAFRDSKTADGGKFHYCGHTEVVFDGAAWNENVDEYLWAFVVPDACLQDSTCRQSFLTYHSEYTQQYGA